MKLPSDQFIWVHSKNRIHCKKYLPVDGSTRPGGWEGDKFHLLSEPLRVGKWSNRKLILITQTECFFLQVIILSLVDWRLGRTLKIMITMEGDSDLYFANPSCRAQPARRIRKDLQVWFSSATVRRFGRPLRKNLNLRSRAPIVYRIFAPALWVLLIRLRLGFFYTMWVSLQ